ncbi:MAG: TonB-dependent receptor [Pseudoxanthomonas sp.]
MSALLAIALAMPAQAAKPAPPRLETIVVTATGKAEEALQVPAAIDVITAQQIRRAQPRINLSETLQRIPGVIARDRNNQAQDLQISIRGFGARAAFGVRGVRLYTDDIPATMPDGQGQVSHFALDSAQRIEVLRGPFSALYGNSSGGVISLFTGDATSPPTIGIDQVLGADGLHRSAASFHAPVGAEPHGSMLVDVAQVDSDGYRDHSASRRRSGQALLKGRLGGSGRYTLLLNSLDLDAEDPQGLTAAQVLTDRRAASAGAIAFDTRKSVRQTQLGAHLEHDLGAHQALLLTVYTGTRRTTQMLSVPVAAQSNPLSGGGAIELDRGYRGADLRWRWSGELAGRPFSIAAGIDDEVSREHRLGFDNFLGARLGVVGALRRDQDDRVNSRDSYAQADWEPAARWRINLGARRSRVRFASNDHYITASNPDDSGSLDYARTSPVAGVLFRLRPWLSAYANAGGGFETPTFAELAYRNDGSSGLNDALRPARSRNVELGLRARRSRLDGSLGLFQSRTRDELVTIANQGGRSAFGNAAQSRRRGIEAALSAELAPAWHVAGAYTFLDARYLRDVARCPAPACVPDDLLIVAGRSIPGTSRHFAWAELRRDVGASFDVALEGRYSSRVFANDANSASAPAYASFDLSAERRFRWAGMDWTGFARINNLAGRRIVGSVIVNEANGRYFEPAPGRNLLIGVSLRRGVD